MIVVLTATEQQQHAATRESAYRGYAENKRHPYVYVYYIHVSSG